MAESWLPGSEIAVEVAFGADVTADASTWTWTDITADVYQDPGVHTVAGRGDEASTAQPAQATFKVRNETGDYSLGGQSANWPNVRRGTPMRATVDPDGSGHATVFFGEVIAWAPGWDLTGTVAAVDVTAAGTLRRLGQGQPPVLSSLRRSLLDDATVKAYWPCEDGKNSAWLLPGVGPHPMTWTTPPELAANSDFASSLAIPTLKLSQWNGAVAPYTATGEVQVRWLCEFPDSDTAETTGAPIMTVYTTGSAAVWEMVYVQGSGGGLAVDVYDTAGGSLRLGGTVDFNVNEDPRARLFVLEMTQNGSDIDCSYVTANAADGVGGGSSFTLSSQTLGAVTSVQANFASLLDNVAVGHVSVHDTAGFGDDVVEALTSHAGENAVTRLQRLAAENGEHLDVVGTSQITMGPQSVTTFLDLAREVEAADGGILLDGLGQGLTYLARTERENRPADLTIDASAKQLAPSFRPVDDDQRTRNRAEITRTGAGVATYEDTDGPLGSDRIGRYTTSATVNVGTDDEAQHLAEWTVHVGTHEGYRHPDVTVDLRATPTLGRDTLALSPSARVDVTSPAAVFAGHPPEDVGLLVEGVSHELTGATWTTNLKCSPYDPWRVAQLTGDTDAVVYVGEGDTAKNPNPGGSGTLFPTYPPNIQPGDLALCMASITNSGTGTIVAPAGWVELLVSGNVSFLGRIYRDGDDRPLITNSGGGAGNAMIAQITAWHGVDRDLSSVVAASAAQLNASDQDIDLPALTVPVDGCAVLAGWWKADDSTSIANPHSFDDGPTDQTNTVNDDYSQGIDYTVQTTAANYSADTCTVTGGAPAISRGFMLALRPDPEPLLTRLDTDGSTLAASISAAATSMQVTTTDAGPISYVGIGPVAVANNASVAPALPAGVETGDLLVLVAAIRNSGTGTVDTPALWDVLDSSGNVSAFGRHYDPTVTAPTVSFTGGVANATTQAQVLAFRGVTPDITSVVESSTTQLNASAQNMAVPGHVAGHDDVAMIVVGWKQDDWTSVAQLTGQFFTEVSDSPTTTGDDAGLEIQYRLGGFTNAKTFSATNLVVTGGASAISRTMVIALQPSTVGLWTTDADDYPIELDVGGVRFVATACSDTTSPQTMTINAAPYARSAGAPISLWRPPALPR